MKKILALALAASTVMATSCKDFLEEENRCGETADLTYNTNVGLNGLVGSCYAFLRGWYGKEPALGLSEMGTDLFMNGGDNQQIGLVTYGFNAETIGGTKNNPCFDEYWEMMYQAISTCNVALANIESATTVDADVRAKYTAEVKFLRALYYFNTINMWGDAPYYDKESDGIKTTAVRQKEEFIYSKILEDLDAAVEGLANVKNIHQGQHVNLYAALSLRSRVFLYAASWIKEFKKSDIDGKYAGQDLYALAQADAEQVIAESGAAFYDDFAKGWSKTEESVTMNKESIWGVVYNNNLTGSKDNTIPYRNKVNTSGDQMEYNSLITRTGYSRGGSAMNLMFVSLWNNGCEDLGGSGAKNTQVFIRPDKAANFYITSAETGQKVNIAEAYSPYGRGFRRYLPTLYFWQTMEKYRETDQRIDGTLLTHYDIASPDLAKNAKNYPLLADTAIYYCCLDGNSEEGKAKQAWAKDRYRIQFAYNGDIPVFDGSDWATANSTKAAKKESDVYGDARYNNVKIGGESSFPGIKKFLDDVFDEKYPCYDISDRDFIVFRLAEMYLIKAECQLKTGGDALATVNELRAARAIAGKDNSRAKLDIDDLLEERAIELCGEFHRWFDLKRTGKLEEYVKARNIAASKNFDASKHYLRPIPEAQMETITNAYSSEFPQNPGY